MRRDPGGHHHHTVGVHPPHCCTEVIQVAVVGRVKGAAVEQRFHFSRSAYALSFFFCR